MSNRRARAVLHRPIRLARADAAWPPSGMPRPPPRSRRYRSGWRLKSLASLTLNGGDARSTSAAATAGSPPRSPRACRAARCSASTRRNTWWTFAAAAFPPAEHPNLRFRCSPTPPRCTSPPSSTSPSPSTCAALGARLCRRRSAPPRRRPPAAARCCASCRRARGARSRTWIEDAPPPRRSGGRGSPIIARLVHPDAGARRGARPRRRFHRQGRRHGSRSLTSARARPFAHFAAGTFVAWTSRLPRIAARRVHRRRALIATRPSWPPPPVKNAFVFDQLEIELKSRTTDPRDPVVQTALPAMCPSKIARIGPACARRRRRRRGGAAGRGRRVRSRARRSATPWVRMTTRVHVGDDLRLACDSTSTSVTARSPIGDQRRYWAASACPPARRAAARSRRSRGRAASASRKRR